MNSDTHHEINRMVAESLGFRDHWFPGDCPIEGFQWSLSVKTIPDPSGSGRVLVEGWPHFSSDWNCAMWAAEKCDLFYRKQSTEVINSLRKDPSGNWAVVESNIIHEDGQTLAEDKTGPLAISKAIIAIHGQQLVSADN